MRNPSLLIFSLLLTIAVALTAANHTERDGGVAPGDLWCVAKNNAEDTALQSAIDWACGPGGADCRPIQQGGSCYDPGDIQSHASYAFNDYFIKNGGAASACDFSGTAALTSLNPGHGSCKFPSRYPNISNTMTNFRIVRGCILHKTNKVVQYWIPEVYITRRIVEIGWYKNNTGCTGIMGISFTFCIEGPLPIMISCHICSSSSKSENISNVTYGSTGGLGPANLYASSSICLDCYIWLFMGTTYLLLTILL